MRSIRGTGIVLSLALIIGLLLRIEPAVVEADPPLIAAVASSSIPAIVKSPDSYRVVKVIDGDTLVIDMNGSQKTLRLIGLDTPETVDPRKAVQCFSKEASTKAKELLEGTRIRIETDPSQGELDKYDRLLVYVYTESGMLFNKYMIAEGYGHEYTYNFPYKNQVEFKAAENSARAEKKGLWADTACAGQTTSMSRRSAVSGMFECSRNTYNCGDFTTQTDAQNVYDACGPEDVHRLDSDGDGEVCESLP